MPDRLAARLAAELDAVKPERPRAAAARYRLAAAAHRPRHRVGGLALLAAAGGLALVALATLATGSPNPQVWTLQVAAGIQRLEDRSGLEGPGTAPPSPPVIGAPAPARTPGEHGPPSQRPLDKPEPSETPRGERDQHSPSPRANPTSHDTSPGNDHQGR